MMHRKDNYQKLLFLKCDDQTMIYETTITQNMILTSHTLQYSTTGES